MDLTRNEAVAIVSRISILMEENKELLGRLDGVKLSRARLVC